MDRRVRPILALLAAVSLVMSLMIPTGTLAGSAAPAPEGTTPAPEGVVRTTLAMDADRNRIFDNLDKILAGAAPGEKVGIIALLEEGHGPAEVQAALGAFETGPSFPAINGFAATMTREQVERLARLPFVVQVEYDAPMYALLNTATYWEGVQEARGAFSVTGDRDGNEISYSPADIVVAIIDTGIDAGHPDLDGGKVIGWRDFVNGLAYPYDDHGHGTHCASIAAGEGQLNPSYKGVAPGAALVGVKVLDSAGSGSTANVNAGIQWCIDNRVALGIEIISLSLGSPGSSDGTDSTSQLVNQAVASGLVATVAAGDYGPKRYTIGSPAAAESGITVGAMADPGERGFSLASSSSRGPTADGRIKPDICAPGVNITAAQRGGGYVSMSGTSMAAPFVAGTAALMLDAGPTLTPQQIKSTMTATAVDWGPPGRDIDYGWGRLDACAAVKSCKYQGWMHSHQLALPSHEGRSGSLSGTGDYDEYVFEVLRTSDPLAITLIMPNWTGSTQPNFDLYLYNPSGTQVASSTTATRQETINYLPTVTGEYKVKVTSTAGSGDYFFDISAGTGLHTLVFSGRVTEDEWNCWHRVNVTSAGYLDLTMEWDEPVECYLLVIYPFQEFVGHSPLTARLWVDSAGVVQLVSQTAHQGSDVNYTLTVAGYEKQTRTGNCGPQNPVARSYFTSGYGGTSYTTLTWASQTTDLDMAVYDAAGNRRALVTQGTTPTRWQDIDLTGRWAVLAQYVSGPATDYTATMYVPENNLLP